MDANQARIVAEVARAADSLGLLHAEDWVELATHMLAAGEDAAPIVDLAILNRSASRWSIQQPIAALYELLDIVEPDKEAAVLIVAQALADDLRAQPEPTISGPMIRAIGRLAATADYASELANECSHAEEFLDCDCLPDGVDPELENRLEHLPPLALPDEFTRLVARPVRATLPTMRPRHGH